MRPIIGFAFALIALICFSCIGGSDDEQSCPDLLIVHNIPCGDDTSWVCGCNDTTYQNECLARQVGAHVVSEGKCGE